MYFEKYFEMYWNGMCVSEVEKMRGRYLFPKSELTYVRANIYI